MSSIKVYLRVRPELPQESPKDTEQNDATLENVLDTVFPFYKIDKKVKNDFFTINVDKKYFNERRFGFERVYDQETSQEMLYDTLKTKILDCAMNGVS